VRSETKATALPQSVLSSAQIPMSEAHIRMLLAQIDLGGADLDLLAIQLTAALDGPLLLFLSATDLAPEQQLADGWLDLVQRVCGTSSLLIHIMDGLN
jgi:hypothetical protein